MVVNQNVNIFVAAKDVEPVLLLANHADIRLIPTSNPKNTRIIATRLEKASFCDFVFQDQLIYWITDDDKVSFLISHLISINFFCKS